MRGLNSRGAGCPVRAHTAALDHSAPVWPAALFGPGGRATIFGYARIRSTRAGAPSAVAHVHSQRVLFVASSPGRRGAACCGSAFGDTKLSDHALVQAVLSGDAASLDQLIERLARVPSMLACLDARTGRRRPPEELADAAQNVLFDVWRKLKDYSGQASLETWVYNFCILELKSSDRRKERGSRFTELGTADEPVQDQLEGLAAVEFEHLHLALEKLPGAQATVIRLKCFEGRTFEDISVQLRIPANTAKTQYYRGLREMRELLKD